MEAYQAAKARLFDTLLAPDGTAVLFSGLPFARALPLRAGARRWTYGRAADDTVRLVRAVQDLGGAWLDVDTPAGRFEVKSLLDAQELDSRGSTGTVYWEGLSDLYDAQGRRVGSGYLEMTGYAGRLNLGG